MGVHTAELYNNLGLCCLYSQQLDLILACFQRALGEAQEDTIKSDIWYNLSHVAIVSVTLYVVLLINYFKKISQGAGDLQLAIQCLNLCLLADSSHAEAFNNLAVLHHKMGRTNLSKAYFSSALTLEPNMIEAKKNMDLLQNN